MTLPVLEYSSPGAKEPRPLLSLLEKCVLIALGVVLPVICFVITAVTKYPLEPEYQSADWYRYISFIPDGRAGYPFYPLLIYCMVSLSAFVVRPITSRLLVVRLGLYTGILLSLQYTFIQSATSGGQLLLVVGIGLASNVILLGIVKGLERIPRKVLIYLVIGLVITAVLGALIPIGRMRIGGATAELFLGGGILSLMFAPAWCCGVYVRASLLASKVNRNPDHPGVSLLTCLAWIPWLGAYAGAWKWSIANAIVLYSKLPVNPPGCYIATAAAAGHPKFVGSAPARAADGSVYPVNEQLRRLKCVEIALATVCPKLHRVIRRIYDHLGPPLARQIAKHPLLADLAFIALKPIDWLSFGVLVAVLPEIQITMKRLYV